jgi:hypothetical protein
VHGHGSPVRGELQQLEVMAREPAGISEPTCMTPITRPPAISGTPIMARIPLAMRIGLTTVV